MNTGTAGVTFGYWLKTGKREFSAAAEAERHAQRHAKRVGEKTKLIRWVASGDGYPTEIADVWPSGQVDLNWTGSWYL
jgi:hypothetical protein